MQQVHLKPALLQAAIPWKSKNIAVRDVPYFTPPLQFS